MPAVPDASAAPGRTIAASRADFAIPPSDHGGR